MISENKVSKKLEISDLKNSLSFLQGLYDNVTSAIFLADIEAKIHHFNDSFTTLFYKTEDQILKSYCGNVIGCEFQVEQGVDCGNTTECESCLLRKSILDTLTRKVPVYKQPLERAFYINGNKINKFFIFTTKYITYIQSEMILIIFDDVTELELTRRRLAENNMMLRKRNNDLEIMITDVTRSFVEINRQLVREKLKEERLVQEIQHRVGNTLQLLISLIQLKSQNLNDKTGKQLAHFIEGKTRCFALIHNCLVEEYDYDKIDLNLYTSMLSEVISNDFRYDQIRFLIDHSNDITHLKIEEATPAGLLLHELFQTLVDSGTVKEVCIDIRNSGRLVSLDISAEKETPHPVLTIDGFSYQLIKTLLMQMGLDMLVEDNEKFEFSMKIRN